MPTKDPRPVRLRLLDRTPEAPPPALAVLAVGRDGGIIHRADVDDTGQFTLPAAAIDKAHRILIGPSDTTPGPESREAFSRYRPAEFVEAIASGELAVARPQWERWRFFRTCVSGRVRLCRRPPWWFDDLVTLARPVRSAASIGVIDGPLTRAIGTGTRVERAPAFSSIDELIAWPFHCRTICNGRVEVYRRRCCCKPWIVVDPRLPDLIKDLEDLVNPPLPDPPLPDPPVPVPPGPGPQPPGPGPDPAPIAGHPAVSSAFFRDGAIDLLAVNAARDLQAIRSLPAHAIAEYVNARPYLICRGHQCTTPVKVGEGEINPDGRFNICFFDVPQILLPWCHYEYAYKVKQRFGLFWFTVYNGVAANQWFSAGEDALLSTSHPLAFACRENGEPGTGAFVYLDLIGDTSSHELETPVSTGWDRTGAFNATSGLVFPTAASPLDRHRNWGGTLKLNYMFSEDLKLVGAKYYRVSVTAATAAGAPIGTREYLGDGLSWRKAVAGGEIVSVSLGPTPVNGVTGLFEIPYDADADWEAGQYHAAINTNDLKWSNPDVRHLVTVEIFDKDGRRLRPTGTPATGQPGPEVEAAFTYRRKTAATGPTTAVPFGALTHAFWWDNRKVEAVIVELVKNGVASDEECQFMVGPGSAQFGITYRAYHPRALFQRKHDITWKRGLSGAQGTLLANATTNVGQPPAAPGASPTESFDTMLGTHHRCAFTVFLAIEGKTTDGDDLSYPRVVDSAAFALEKD